MDKILQYTLEFFTSITPAQWYVVGSVLGGSTLLIGVIAWIKRRHLKKNLEKLESWFIQANLVFWGLAITLLGFIVQHGGDLSVLFPYLGTHAPQLIVLATTLFSFSKGIKSWFEKRKASKKTVVDDIKTVIEAPEPTDVPEPDPLPQQPPRPGSDLLS